MIDLGPHATFIIWAYIGVGLGVGGLIAWTVFDSKRMAHRLTALEARDPRKHR